MDQPQVDFEAFGQEFKTKSVLFIDAIDGLSKNQVIRVLKKITLYPLEDDKIELQHREEVRVFNLGVEIFTAKVNMTVAYIGEHAKNGTEMINEAEGDTPEEKVENAIKESKEVSEEDKIKAQIEMVEKAPEIVKDVIKKPKKKAKKKAEKKDD